MLIELLRLIGVALRSRSLPSFTIAKGAHATFQPMAIAIASISLQVGCATLAYATSGEICIGSLIFIAFRPKC